MFAPLLIVVALSQGVLCIPPPILPTCANGALSCSRDRHVLLPCKWKVNLRHWHLPPGADGAVDPPRASEARRLTSILTQRMAADTPTDGSSGFLGDLVTVVSGDGGPGIVDTAIAGVGDGLRNVDGSSVVGFLTDGLADVTEAAGKLVGSLTHPVGKIAEDSGL
ncbi:hypothetical protein BD779DRAFT_1671755 [Infundibulicybe gibba]|nr:hypothetical protein BD779DRAFT_1671755 [Infundibulicybe gibba]